MRSRLTKTLPSKRPPARVFALASALAIGACAMSSALAQPVSERNYYVPDVPAQFAALTQRAEALGFGIGESPDPTLCYHYQGIARRNGPGTPYLFVSKSGNQPPAPCFEWCDAILPVPCTRVGDGPGSLLVVRMGSRETSGERLRSNRLSPGETANSRPDPADTTVTVLTFDGNDEWPAYGHPGGMQAVGDVLAVALETRYDDSLPKNMILFLNVSEPESPRYLSFFDPGASPDFSAGLVAVARRPSGRYLMLVAGLANKEVRIFESGVDDDGVPFALSDPLLTWTHVDTFFAEEDGPDVGQLICRDPTTNVPISCWPIGSGAHQSLNFVREGGPDGQLYLVGARNTGFGPLPGAGSDRFDLYRIEWEGGDFKLRWVDTREVQTFPSSEAYLLPAPGTDPFGISGYEIANFAAASGAYVSPSGELIMYATEHDNDGPSVDGKKTVKAGEWRHIDMVRRGSPTLGPSLEFGGPHVVEEGATTLLSAVGKQPVSKAWVQLWADPHFSDRYLVIDYLDWFKDDFDDFKRLDGGLYPPGFSDQASSLRYFAPEGCTIRVNDDDFGDDNFPGPKTRTLPGAGLPVRFDDLDDVSSDDGDGDIDDELTSAQFFGDCDAYYGAAIEIDWDLDGVGDFEESGNVVTYSAELVDGPSDVSVLARATHPVDGRTTLGLTEVTVVNVAPTIEALSATDGLGRDVVDGQHVVIANLPVALAATFDDQFAFDTHTAVIDWGDGTTTSEVEADAFVDSIGIATQGRIAHAHAYADAGEYSIEVTVVDDDGGATSETVDLVVVGAEEAIGLVVDTIDELLAGETNVRRLIALHDARDALIGNHDGIANNGALDHLEGGRLNPVMLRLADAITHLAEAESAGVIIAGELSANLVLAAHALAIASLRNAMEANPIPPDENVMRQTEEAEAAIDAGALLAAMGDYTDALEQFRAAVLATEPLY